jgi:hypothetical protein
MPPARWLPNRDHNSVTAVNRFVTGDPLVSLGQDCEDCWSYQGPAIHARLVDYGDLTCCEASRSCPGCTGTWSVVEETCDLETVC